MIRFANAFVKITGFIPSLFAFRMKLFYEDKKDTDRYIKGPALIISNHTSVYDYAAYLFVFWTRTLRTVIAECLFERKLLGAFLKCMGGIYVNRQSADYAFADKAVDILKKGGTVLIFPESRLPFPEEKEINEFKVSVAYIAKKSGAPVIPLCTNGCYFQKKPTRILIGKKFYANDLSDGSSDKRKDIAQMAVKMREKVVELQNELGKIQ